MASGSASIGRLASCPLPSGKLVSGDFGAISADSLKYCQYPRITIGLYCCPMAKKPIKEVKTCYS